MSGARRFLRSATVLALFILATSSVAADEAKFQSSYESGGSPGKYRVQVDLRPGDDPIAISNQLAATYGVRIEPYAEEGFSGFVIVATPTRARQMSFDPRIATVRDFNVNRETMQVRRTEPAEAVVVTPAQPPTAIAVPVRKEMRSEAVPGFGSYTYDGSGNITSIDAHVFRYDSFGRLHSAVLGTSEKRTYAYDQYGNILSVTINCDEPNPANCDETDIVRMGVDPETNQMDLPVQCRKPGG